MAEAFTWGSGGEQETTTSRARRRLAEALMMEGSSTAPVQSWTQGLNRVAQALVGGYELSKEDQRDQQQQADAQAILASHPAFAGASSPGVAKVASALAGPVVPDDSNAIPGTVGMDQRLADRTQDFIQDNPGTSMTSGVRSRADQARLYADRASNSNPVAPPGTSLHERGMAVDIAGMTPQQRALLPQYGLAQPVANDPVHVQLAGDPAALPANSEPTQGYAVPGQPAPIAGPQMPPAVSSYVQRALRNPLTRSSGLAVLNNYAKPRESYTQETDADGNVWSVNQQTGQRTVALKHDKPEEQARPMTPEERVQYGIPANAAVAMTRYGPKAIGSGPSTTVNVGGGTDKQIFDEFVERSKAARSTAQGLSAIRTARAAIDGGAITGFNADNRLQLQKAASLFGITEPDKIQNSEVFKAAIAPQVAAVLKATVGNANISDSDRRFAERAAGGSLDLDEGSIKRLLDIMEKASVAQLQEHQEALDAVYPDPTAHKRERALFGIKVPTGAAPPAGATKSGIKWSVE
ncbi:M15 family metallopeptidase [Bradyrhizobium sp. CCBAU 21362]|uniref:M15 family metallopeptidase n=1 Tax=Bradyrhizobium sp. CCBAU 21362 TaxID=1325082 RepID=UPI002305BD26|nr:M15 family metallopeptidase [Bradyrhizobium sp. CCBAU 21362]